MMNIFQRAIAACTDNQLLRTDSAGVDFVNHIKTSFQFLLVRRCAVYDTVLQTAH